MCKTQVRLNDITLVTEINGVILEIAFFVNYPWKNGVVYVKDAEEKTFRSDLALVLEEKNVREYVLGTHFGISTSNYHDLTNREFDWIKEMVAFYERKPNIIFNIDMLFPSQETKCHK